MKALRTSSKGQTLVLVALLLTVLLALAGLAVDVGMAYGVKAKLYAAVDVAAIAAGKVVSDGRNAAEDQARYFFNANYPSDIPGANLVSLVPTATLNPDKSWTITVTAIATVPTNFAKVVGFPEFTVEASATSIIRTLDLILVLDSSGSLSSPGNTMQKLGDAAKQFIAKFQQSNDRVGLIHYAAGTIVDVPITETKGFNPVTINSKIQAIVDAGAAGSTTSEDALQRAKAQLDAITSKNSLRAIVLFTDGAPNGIAARFSDGTVGNLYSQIHRTGGGFSDWNSDPCPVNANRAKYRFSGNALYSRISDGCSVATLPATDNSPDPGKVSLQSYNNIRAWCNPPTTGGDIPNTKCNVNQAARNMLENVAFAARTETPNPIYIFTIGLGDSLRTLEVDTCGYNASTESGENILRRLANVPGVDTYNQIVPDQTSGLYVYAANAAELNRAFDQVANVLLRLTK